MSSSGKLHNDNFQVYVRFRPINKLETESCKEENLTVKLDKFGLTDFRKSLRNHKKFRDPKNWHSFREENSTNNQFLSDIGLQPRQQQMFRKLLQANSAEELSGEHIEDVIPYKVHLKEHRLESLNPKTKEVKSFSYDNILGSNTTQLQAFKMIGYRTVEGVLNGVNGTIFAYGQSGTGKTFSLLGPEPLSKAKANDFGILPMSVHYIFHSIGKNDNIIHYEITVSFLEIYQEKMKDLIEPTLSGKKERSLKILEMTEGEFRLFMAEKEGSAALRQIKTKQGKDRSEVKEAVIVQNLSEHRVQSAKDFVKLCVMASANRTKHKTMLNASSSHSHMICQAQVRISKRNGTKTIAKLNIVDLAGSEKISTTKVKGVTLIDAKSINASLTALRTVIDGLAKGKKFIPFRDSKLSMILKDSLGGNTRTSLLVTVSPHKWNFEETMLTLEFGKKAKFVQNKVKVNLIHDEQEMVKRLEKNEVELRKLKRMLNVTEKELNRKDKKVKNLEKFLALSRKLVPKKLPSQRAVNLSPQLSIVELLRASTENLRRTSSSGFNTPTSQADKNSKINSEHILEKFAMNSPNLKRSSLKQDFPPESERKSELEVNRKLVQLEASWTTEKCSKLEAENKELHEKLRKTVVDLEKRIQDLELQLVEKDTELKKEKLARIRIEENSSTDDSAQVIKKLRGLLLEKSNELKREREVREMLELKVQEPNEKKEILLDRIIEEEKESLLAGISHQSENKEDLSSLVSSMFEEKSQNNVTQDDDHLPLIKKRSRKNSKLRKRGLPKVRVKSTEEKKDERFSIISLTTGLSQKSVGLLDALNFREKDILKVWLMMMMAIHEMEAEDKLKPFSLAQFFNFHSGLSLEMQKSLQIARMFGILDNRNVGLISGQELSTFFKQVREIDALKWGYSTNYRDINIPLARLMEVLEVSFFTANGTFKDMDIDGDGWLSKHDLVTYLKNKGGRQWWNDESDYSEKAIVEVLMRLHLMKWNAEFGLQDFDDQNPPPVSEEEFDYYLKLHYIGSSYMEIKDDFLATLPMEVDRFEIFEHIIPNWRSLFEEYLDSEKDVAKGLSVEGAQEIVRMLRASIEEEAPKVDLFDKAVIYLKGLNQTQMEMMVRSCPVKIWQTLVDPYHVEPVRDIDMEFQKLKRTIAEALLLMQETDKPKNYINDESEEILIQAPAQFTMRDKEWV